MLLFAVLIYQVMPGRAAVCLICHGGVEGCEGGTACPFYTGPFYNSEILRSESGTHTVPGAEGAEETVYTMVAIASAAGASILPHKIRKFLSRGVLDFFKTVARRGPANNALDVSYRGSRQCSTRVSWTTLVPCVPTL